MATNSILLDGAYQRGIYVGRAKKTYPFLYLGDSVTVVIERRWQVSEAYYLPPQLGIERDPENRMALLVVESEPNPIGIADILEFKRTFATIPPTETDSAHSVRVQKPNPALASYPGTIGSARIFRPDTSLLQFDAYARRTVTTDSGAPANFYPTGGTYPLTFGADTAAANAYNASAATLQTALNLLASIISYGGVTVSGSYNSTGGLSIVFASIIITQTWTNLGTGFHQSGSALYGGYYTNVAWWNALAAPDGAGGTTTFTLTVFGQTTASIAYNATPAQVQTALNALSNVVAHGGCTVAAARGTSIYYTYPDAGGYQWINFYISFLAPLITSSATSLTPAPATVAIAASDPFGRTQTLRLLAPALRTITCISGHEIAPEDTIALHNGSVDRSGISGAFVVTDPYTIVIIVEPAASYAADAAYTEIGRRTQQNYGPGSTDIPCDIVTRFSLSTITPATFQGDDASILTALLAGTTSINFEVGKSYRWPSATSPINAIDTTIIDATLL